MAKRLLLILIVILMAIPVCSQAGIPGFKKYRMGTMEGQVLHDNVPVSNALVSFFDSKEGLPPLEKLGGRIPDFLSRTDGEGKFKAKLLKGSYYLGILIRSDNTIIGPPREGEIYYFADDGEGRLRKISIADFEEIDAGVVIASLPEVFSEVEDFFTVEGTVYQDEGGDPFEGAIVLAKTTPTMRRPQYFSERTGKDGKFTLKLPPDLTLYLVTRENISGTQPTTGESIGKYGADSYTESSAITAQGIGSPPPGVAKKETPRIIADSIPITGSRGEVISGLKIVMYKMPDQNELRADNMRSAEAPDYETGFSISNLYFALNSHELDERSFAELDLWVNFFMGRRDIAIELIGHTDNVGSDEYNLQLSRKRAETVAEYLASKGVSSARISVSGFGSSKPVASNDTEEGRSKNRRVDIKFEK